MLQRVKYSLSSTNEIVGRCFGIDVGEFVDVSAGNKAVWLARINDQTRGWRRSQTGDDGLEFEQNLAIQHVGASGLLVQAQPGEPLGVYVQLPVRSGRIAVPTTGFAGAGRTHFVSITSKSQSSGKWSEKVTFGTEKSLTLIPSL